MGGETLAAENEVELEVLVVRSRPSCLMLSSTGWAAVTSFQSCWRSEGHTAMAWGESTHCQRGGAPAPAGTQAPGWLGNQHQEIITQGQAHAAPSRCPKQVVRSTQSPAEHPQRGGDLSSHTSMQEETRTQPCT